MAEVVVNGLIEGGKATSGPPFGPALGPLGVNVAKIIAEINTKTDEFSGIKVPVKILIDTDTKSYRIEIGSPPTSALLLKEIGVQKGAKAKGEVVGNITMVQLKKVMASKENALFGSSAKQKLKQVIGTCVSMGITVEGMPAKEALKKVGSGELKL